MGRAYVLKFILLSMIIFSRPRSLSLPFVIFHGIGSSCKSWGDDYASHLSKWANSTGYCLEIGNGRWDSWFMPLTKQIEIACKEVKRMTQLEQGFNVVGYSQGALIARGMIETCDGAPPIRNFISVAGPHAGITIAPRCVDSGIICRTCRRLIKIWIYSDYLQKHLAPAGYIKLPNHVSDYLQKNHFLPLINNERISMKSEMFKTNFSNLQNLILIMNNDDEVLDPPVTAWFGFYSDGSFNHIVPPKQGELYLTDRIGLRSLHVKGRVQFVNVSGRHLEMTSQDRTNYVVSYLWD